VNNVALSLALQTGRAVPRCHWLRWPPRSLVLLRGYGRRRAVFRSAVRREIGSRAILSAFQLTATDSWVGSAEVEGSTTWGQERWWPHGSLGEKADDLLN